MNDPTSTTTTGSPTPAIGTAESYVPQIMAAHKAVVEAEQRGYSQALTYAVNAGDLLKQAKETVGHGDWSEWRKQHLRDIPQTTASLYMRLAENKAKFREKEISNGVANLGAEGKLSIRSAAKLLPKSQSRGSTNRRGTSAKTLANQLEAFKEKWEELNEYQKRAFVKAFMGEIAELIQGVEQAMELEAKKVEEATTAH